MLTVMLKAIEFIKFSAFILVLIFGSTETIASEDKQLAGVSSFGFQNHSIKFEINNIDGEVWVNESSLLLQGCTTQIKSLNKELSSEYRAVPAHLQRPFELNTNQRLVF